MKAIQINQFGSNDVLQYVDVPIPNIQEDEVLIKVAATSVNYADIKTRNGKYHAAGNPPLILGMEVVGEIVGIGKHVKRFEPKMPVLAFTLQGSYAQYVIAKESLTFELPSIDSMPLFFGAPLVAFTSYKLIKQVAQLQKGETIVIHGAAGGIGTTAIQLAKHFGASKVIGTVSIEAKMAIANKAGADVVLLMDDTHLAEKVKQETGEHGVNVVLDSYAGEVTERGLAYLAPFGRLVLFGDATQKTPNIDIRILQSTCRTIVGYSLGTVRNLRPQDLADGADELIQLIDQGVIQIQVGRTFTLAEAAQAMAFMESRQSVGKIVLTIQ